MSFISNLLRGSFSCHDVYVSIFQIMNTIQLKAIPVFYADVKIGIDVSPRMLK